MANPLYIKGSKTRVLNTFPTRTFGQDGDIVISRITGKGVYLCSKAGGMWYAANRMQELRKVEKSTIRELTTNKLTVNNLIDANKNTDRFLVGDLSVVKYRTGDEVLDDLDIPITNIDYKTAYCSLGQYSDKEMCEANGGTWYYSENDSHDNISSTAENQLLTVSQSIGKLDAESTLTYDGSVLQIKKNSDYDDNWQSSVQEAQLRFNDGTYYTGFKAHSAMTANSLYTLPAAYPGANKVLQSDTSGNLTWVSDVGAITALNNATANELVTVGATTTELDAEANLTFDGKTLEVTGTDILYKTFKVSYDGSNSCSIDVVASGDSTIQSGGDLTLKVGGDCLNFNDGVNTFGEFYMNGTLLKLLGAQGYAIELETSSAGGATQDITLDSSKDIVLDSAADIILDSGSGDFIAKKAGTEFRIANSAYAGMILGYRMIGEDATHASYTLTTSFAVPNSDMTVRFIAPPSGCVEVMVQIYANASTSNRFLYLGLSDNATYNSLGATYEHVHRMPDETDDELCQHYWTITGLTAGDTYNYWLGAKTSLTNAFLNWGGTGSGRYGDFIMKVTALPAATSDFAEYD